MQQNRRESQRKQADSFAVLLSFRDDFLGFCAVFLLGFCALLLAFRAMALVSRLFLRAFAGHQTGLGFHPLAVASGFLVLHNPLHRRSSSFWHLRLRTTLVCSPLPRPDADAHHPNKPHVHGGSLVCGAWRVYCASKSPPCSGGHRGRFCVWRACRLPAATHECAIAHAKGKSGSRRRGRGRRHRIRRASIGRRASGSGAASSCRRHLLVTFPPALVALPSAGSPALRRRLLALPRSPCVTTAPRKKSQKPEMGPGQHRSKKWVAGHRRSRGGGGTLSSPPTARWNDIDSSRRISEPIAASILHRRHRRSRPAQPSPRGSVRKPRTVRGGINTLPSLTTLRRQWHAVGDYSSHQQMDCEQITAHLSDCGA